MSKRLRTSLPMIGLAFGLGMIAPVCGYAAGVTSLTPASFADGAAIDNRFEIAVSQLAVQKSSDKRIVELAQGMLATHQKADMALANVMRQANPPLPAPPGDMDKAHQGLMTALNRASEKDFNKVWLTVEAKAYDEAVSLYSIYADKGADGDLKSYAQAMLADMRKDQRQLTALQMGKGVGGAINNAQ